jgi:DUF917 family protein
MRLEQHMGRKVDALLGDEVGGGNGIAPMLTAAMVDLPVVDADGMGRAFPEVQMTTFFIHGQEVQPAALADADGNVLIVTEATSPEDAGKAAARRHHRHGLHRADDHRADDAAISCAASACRTRPARPGPWVTRC